MPDCLQGYLAMIIKYEIESFYIYYEQTLGHTKNYTFSRNQLKGTRDIYFYC